MKTSRWFLEAVLIVVGGGVGLYLAIHDTRPAIPPPIEVDKIMRGATTAAVQRDLRKKLEEDLAAASASTRSNIKHPATSD